MATNTAPRNVEEREPEERETSEDAQVPVAAAESAEAPAAELPADEAGPSAEEELAEERARLSRALQELDAARARVQRDAKIVNEETRSKLVSELLPVLDNFDRAIAAAAANGDAPAVVDGMRLVHRQLERVLEGYGLARFDATGVRFDPQVHEAMSMVPVTDPAQDMVVIAQHEPGYKFGERLLRAAKVVVGKHG